MDFSLLFSSRYYRFATFIFVIVFLANAAYLHRVPGLLGDEASEGHNVYELLQSEKIVITGERSYIGPLIDYIRVPFIGALGYSIMALRLPIFLATLISFWLAAVVFKRLFDETPALFALGFFFLSPPYLLYERLGWAITLIPFLSLLLLFFVTQRSENKSVPIIAGLIAGIGLSNHLLFLPTLVAIVVGWGLPLLLRPRQLLSWWPAIVGFWAGFAMQFTVMLLWTEDQGDPSEVAQLFWERLSVVPTIWHAYVSGSLYVSGYIGSGFHPVTIILLSLFLTMGAVSALIFSQRRIVVAVWIVGMMAHLLTLVYMVDRFTLRYFAPLVLSFWIISGVGYGALVERLFKTMPRVPAVLAIISSIVLVGFTSITTLLPYLRTGGSLARFDVGNHAESAAALVDTRPLLSCIQGIGTVYSENVHIQNRLILWQHQYPSITLGADEKNTEWLIDYRNHTDINDSNSLCHNLAHFTAKRP